MKNSNINAILASGHKFEFPVALTPVSFQHLAEIDKFLVGTASYMGLHWFWSPEFAYLFRGENPLWRKKAHDAFVVAGLSLNGDTDAHIQVLDGLIPCDVRDNWQFLREKLLAQNATIGAEKSGPVKGSAEDKTK